VLKRRCSQDAARGTAVFAGVATDAKFAATKRLAPAANAEGVQKMKKALLGIFVALLVPTSLSAQVRVQGYVNKNGTYVAPYYRSSPNSTKLDNYSTQGNVNPYTGKLGTRDVSSNPYNYSSNSNDSPSSYGSAFGQSKDTYGADPE
jgi:hypothetical protein